MANPVVHWEIGGRDLDALTDFYRQLFGWEPVGYDGNYRLVTPDGGVGGGLMRCTEDMPPYVTVYIAVDDLEAALAKAEALGGKRVVPPTPIPGTGSFALLEDVAGNTVGLLQLAAA